MSTISKSKTVDNLLKHKLAENKENKVILSKEEIEENVIEWTTFFRRNLDIFNNDFLEIPTHLFQNNMILTMQDNDITDDICSRGASKSFTTGIVAVDFALLYSNCNVLITSFTLNQSNNIIDEKIDKELSNPKSGISPVLRQLRIDEWMEIKKDPNTGAKFVSFGNGSKIFAVNCGESARGVRAQVVITDECVLIKKKDYEEIIEPTLTQRQFQGRPIDYFEEPKQIFLSSAKTKTNWMWKHLKNCVKEHYKNKRIKYGFFSVDIFTAVASGIQSKNQYIQRKKSVDDISFEQEYLNMFLGSNENSLFKVEDFEVNQILDKAFYVRTPEEYIEGIENKYHYSNDWVRLVACDVALATGNENDNSIYLFMCVNKQTGQRKVECILSANGLNTLTQAMLIKRYFTEYQAEYLILDVKGVGGGLYDALTVETFDSEFGITYPAWTVCKDKNLQISSDSVMNDKIQRTLSQDAEEVIIPFAGTAELNTQIHIALRKALRDKTISFLKDDSEIKVILEDKDPKFVTKSATERANILLPFLQTRYLINETISLDTTFTENGNIKLKESNRMDTKDRYMTLAMANLLADKIYARYAKNGEDEEFNIKDWSFLAN